MPCEPAPPCEPTFPLFCEPLPVTTSGQRVVVEDLSSCQKTISKSANPSILHQNFVGNLVMSDGSDSLPIRLPQISEHALSQVPKIMVLLADGTVKAWEPSDTGDNFLAYWDGVAWKIGNLSSLFPGNGVFVKDSLGVISLVNGSAGESLQYVGSNIEFAPQSLTPVPTGMILPYAAPISVALPSGYLECNGSPVSQATYANLFAIIGNTYDTAPIAGQFSLPDLRGYFIRGFGTNSDGATSGAFGAKQQDSIVDHTHNYSTRQSNMNVYSSFGTPSTSTSTSTLATGNVNAPHNGGTETKPKNIAMRYLIKT